ncbi:MAG TPA: DNA translocase FtsK [Verrucomicrobiales bacterium]|nr:DNA translocase FtsK [Verrucomicrobiales bacterium]HIL68349.1 DNA translocase FtsK [Verrucomicrobiota bacterium]
MARPKGKKIQHEAESRHNGLNDTIGLVLVVVSFLLGTAMLSFDPGDVDFNKYPANETIHNRIGPVGAWAANACFFLFGIVSYVFPLLILGTGTCLVFQWLNLVKKKLIWIGLIMISTICLADRAGPSLENWSRNLNLPSAGGFFGKSLNEWVFSYFGSIGAPTILLLIVVLSIANLTQFGFLSVLQRIPLGLLETIRGTIASMAHRAPVEKVEQEKLESKVRTLRNKAKKVQKQMESTAPPPETAEPVIRDRSQSKRIKGNPFAKSKEENPEESEPEDLTQREHPEPKVYIADDNQAYRDPSLPPASTADVLGDPINDSVKPGNRLSGDIKPPPNTTQSPKGKMTPRTDEPIRVASTPLIGDYHLPSTNLLALPDQKLRPTETKETLMANAHLMKETLAQFGIEVALGNITKGPTITRYELHPAPGVRLEKIANLGNNITAALKAERINILVPIPGSNAVGIEVPNKVKTMVTMRDVFDTEEWVNTKARIPVVLGKDVYGSPLIGDLAEMPHLLIAGATGSGKSVCINVIIASLLTRFSPDELRFVMIDPKVVELQQYNALPHLVVPVVTNPKKVVLALRWVVNEMEKRYQIFAQEGVRNIASFNARKPKPVESESPDETTENNPSGEEEGFAVELDEKITVPREDQIEIPEKLSYVVVIIDELADLMLVAPADVEMAIARITQMARAAGIHCIVATQRPSVDVITGIIKANIPTRIAFQVASKVDSRTILDAMGADKLLGKGDMFYLPPGSGKLIRSQGAFITDDEIQAIVDYIAKQGKPCYESDILQQLSKPVSLETKGNGSNEDEELIERCINVIQTEGKASVSLMQRRLRLGYTRAARIMDELENRGVVGPSKGAEPRDILIDVDVS